MRHAKARPTPKPMNDPIRAWVESLLAADLRASRSDCWRLIKTISYIYAESGQEGI
jgi:hypothetical protein